jgi:glycosyltransferase involved in cell wall biosynthesis
VKVIVILEQRFDRTPDGAVWTQVAFAYSFWTRYLDVFDGVRVVARVRDVSRTPPNHIRADGPGVTFSAVPYYIGPWQYLFKHGRVVKAVRAALGPEDAVIMRVGSQLAACLYPVLRNNGRPFGIEVVCDPWGAFSPGTMRSVFRPFFRRWGYLCLKKQCANACAAAYVTERALQSRYPVGREGYATSYSSIELPNQAILGNLSLGISDVEMTDGSYVPSPNRSTRGQKCVKLIFIGSFAQMYKAPDVLIDAAAQCVRDGMNLELVMIGDGRYATSMKSRANRLGISDRVHFRGQLPFGNPIRDELDQADIFVLPSRQEGLPRAMIEAMARALPCIGSTIGGIPELLPAEDMVPPGDANALAGKIAEVAADPARMRRMSVRNLNHAQRFRDDLLQQRRIVFYKFVRERTEDWINKSKN